MQRKSLALALIAIALSTAASAGDSPVIEDAHRAYNNAHYRRALALYEQLSASGDAEAAERAGFMLFLGGQLYGSQVRRDPLRAKALLIQAAKAGRRGAGFVLNMIEPAD